MFVKTLRNISTALKNLKIQGCSICFHKRFSIISSGQKNLPPRYLGQPSPFTHPHLLKTGEVTPGLSQVEYALRRHKLLSLIHEKAESLGTSDHAIILLSHPTYYMTNDIPFPFHQNTNFLYLCGFQEPDSILLLHNIPGKSLPSHKAVLFVQRRNQNRELWDGPRSGVDGAVSLTGVDEAYTMEEFRPYMQRFKDEGCMVWYDSEPVVHPRFHADYIQPLIATKMQSNNTVQPVQKLVQCLRLIKSDAEVELMKTAAKVTSKAFISTMFSTKAPVDEAYLYAKFDFECRAHGADLLAYPPVVAGGNRSNTLHYVKNNQMVKDGEMVLLDGGCEYSGYVSDVTRVWPVSGRFTEPQAELYQTVLDVQKSCLSLCIPSISLENIYTFMLTTLGQKLKDIGILQKNSNQNDAYKAAVNYCPHHVGHYLGMDVHDTPGISRSIALQPGMVVTIEPGIYIPEHDTSAPSRFRGMGIRIEDDVLITEEGPIVLSADCPKELHELEQIWADR
ncbi:xaa-Pro aminopeptidase 3 [Hemiscyllium ocellatum]|uniref:xaa-Pro aminopeptidase 3 n=1 Tax=Hemiscyllium ocellatum TaxID=170820 RepID=UPI0029663F17|nr:xaa-Pro aminopeptidase 3 [Hemiscyllium ocellatum]